MVVNNSSIEIDPKRPKFEENCIQDQNALNKSKQQFLKVIILFTFGHYIHFVKTQ